jgi:Holliday junction resolvasome RuvABC endonuclease subunit
MTEYGIGIDPGWKNIGLAIVSREVGSEKVSLVHSCVLNPAELGGIIPALKETCRIIEKHIPDHEKATIYTGMERYVSYQNVNTAEAENILMMIGALMVGLNYYNSAGTKMVRAIEWKTGLVKALFKWKKFTNPSDKLDKKFSVAAANCLTDNAKHETNHESDAICIAALPFVPGFK